MWKDFKAFAMKGSVLDMAIGIIIGSAFGNIVHGLVNDIIMPPFGLVLGRVNFVNLFIDLSKRRHYASLADAQKAGAAVIAYGHFVNTVIDFLIVAFAMFLTVKWFNSLKKTTPPPPSNKECPYCFSSIPIRATRCPNCTSELTPA